MQTVNGKYTNTEYMYIFIHNYIYNIYAYTAKFSFLKIKIFRDQNK